MDFAPTLLALVPLVPLLGAILAYSSGCTSSKRLAGIIASLASLASFGCVLWLVKLLLQNGVIHSELFTWVSVADLKVKWGLQFDSLSAVMCLLITGVGSLIHIYSIDYMHEDKSQPRFFAYLNLFLFFMLMLVLGDSLLSLFVGWEGVGLASYLLIGFWFTNPEYAKAGQKAFVMNRIGDLGLLIAMFLIVLHWRTLDIAAVTRADIDPTLAISIAGCLLLGAFGKSAQFPLYTWLPDAMAGPTPVSALIHAATMVTGGIYLVARFSPIFSATPVVNEVLACVAVATALMSGLTALVQTDIKKVLAFSTVSQLGLMFAALSAGAYWVAIFHVLTHGFFKACLFLGAGSVIHSCHHEQDMRKYGGLWKSMPYTAVSFGFATLALAAIAPFAGFYSKHAILEAFASSPAVHSLSFGNILANLTQIASFLTALYMGRCFALTFLGKYRGEAHPHEAPILMRTVLVILATGSVVSGFVLALDGRLQNFLSSVLSSAPAIEVGGVLESFASSSVAIAGLLLGLSAYAFFPSFCELIRKALGAIPIMLDRSYFLDGIYEIVVVRPLQVLGWVLWKIGDNLVIEGVVQSPGWSVRLGGSILRLMQIGQVRLYAFWMLISLVTLVAMLLLGTK